jgi:hypothetical protein
VVSKAASVITNKIPNINEKGHFRLHVAENYYENKSMSLIITDLVFKMENNRNLFNQVYSLFAGTEYNREEPPKKIDISRLEKIIRKNAFDTQNHIESIDLYHLNKELSQQLKLLDYEANELDRIDLKTINFETDTYKKLSQIQTDYNRPSLGLWILPSFFNHSCISNTFQIIIGDIMLIYSKLDLNKGEELTLSYVASHLKYSIRNEKLSKCYKFECECELCCLDKNDTMNDIRNKLLQNIFSNNDKEINELINDVNKMKCTYLKRSKYNVYMIYPLELLANKYRMKLMFNESAKCFMQIFETIKECNEYISLAALKEAYIDYRKCGLLEISDSCKVKAREYFVDFKLYFDQVWNKISLVF